MRALDLIAVVVLAAVLEKLYREGAAGQALAFVVPSGDWNTDYLSEPDQSGGWIDDAVTMIDPTTYFPAAVSPDVAAQNERAFLDLIAYAEGTSGPDGYRTMFGYRYFDSYADHPRQYFPFTDGAGRKLTTSAAGRYQFIARTWDGLRAKLNLPDFSPESQDAAALELVREKGALNDVRAGRVASAVSKVRKVWASLPGAGYAQPERDISSLVAVFQRSGGTLEG